MIDIYYINLFLKVGVVVIILGLFWLIYLHMKIFDGKTSKTLFPDTNKKRRRR